ncbi:MAG: hypothetical protein HZB72_09010 [Burkholderiales bacterium]|nr:hypothetical protein [Burkholderiales bacterium]
MSPEPSPDTAIDEAAARASSERAQTLVLTIETLVSEHPLQISAVMQCLLLLLEKHPCCAQGVLLACGHVMARAMQTVMQAEQRPSQVH